MNPGAIKPNEERELRERHDASDRITTGEKAPPSERRVPRGESASEVDGPASRRSSPVSWTEKPNDWI